MGDGMLKLKKDKLVGQKRLYIALIIILLIGIFLGLIYPWFLSLDNKELLITSIESFFNNVQNENIDYGIGLKNSFLSNLSYLLGIWFLGISIIGLPLIGILLILRGFLFGFSISSIISVYRFKGIIGAFSYIFPSQILSLITIVLLTFYAVSFSFKLFRYLFLKENLNFKPIMNKYLKILGICFISFSIVSLMDAYLQPIIMKLFTFFLK